MTDQESSEPKSHPDDGQVHYVTARCTECEACISRCPTRAIYAGINQAVIDIDRCHGCRVCVSFCPVNAILPLRPAKK
jgi:Pyruvate/2-oxoacid:ferredoxin oxidoreductase delta subunit